MKKLFWLLLIAVFLAGCATQQPSTPQPLLTPEEFTVEEPGIPEPIATGEGINVGDRAPNFTVTTINNETFTLNEFTTGEKPILLYFMATWCPYCAKDYAALSTLYDQYDVEILSIDLDLNENADDLREYRKKYPALEKMLWAPGNINVLAKYQVRSTTTKYALDPQGKILYKGSGAFTPDQWALLLQTLESS